MKTIRTRAIVLRRTNYGEADRILQLLTPEGRRGALARGVRKEKSKLAGGIELFAVSDVVLTAGKGDLAILTSARLVQFYRHILEDYDRLQFGYAAIKVVARASETVDEPEWYELLREVLMGLDAQSIALPLVQSWFFLRYAALLGHELNMERTTDGERMTADGIYRYDTEEQGFRSADTGDITGEHIKLLRLVGTKPLSVLVQIGGIGKLLPECLFVARAHAGI